MNILKGIVVTLLTIVMGADLMASSTNAKIISISGQISGAGANRILEIKKYALSIPGTLSENVTYYRTPLNENGEFSVSIEVLSANSCYMEMSLNMVKVEKDTLIKLAKIGRGLFSQPYLFEPGDSVLLQVNVMREKVTFTGIGADKLQCQYFLKEMRLPSVVNERAKHFFAAGDRAAELHFGRSVHDALLELKRRILESYEEKLTPSTYELLELNMLVNHEYELLQRYNLLLSIASQDVRQSVRRIIDEHYSSDFYFNYDEQVKLKSSRYASLVFLRNKLILSQDSDAPVSFKKMYTHLKLSYRGELRSQLLVLCFFNVSGQEQQEAISFLPDALSITEQRKYKSMLANWNDKHIPGQKAEHFYFYDVDDRKYTASDFKGQIVVLDFWYTGCSACAEAIIPLENVIATFSDRDDVIFLSINTDKKEMWVRGLELEIYTSKKQKHLYLGEQGRNHPMILHYDVWSFPYFMVFNKQGELLSSKTVDPRQDEGENLIEIISSNLIN